MKGKKTDALIPPGGMFVLRAKDGRTRTVPLNKMARELFSLLLCDSSTGRWLFLNRDGNPLQSFKKGFAQTCERAGIADLRPYDLRHTFATRLVDRGVISALLGHSTPVTGFGYASRITPGYAHVTWEAMARAVETLEAEPPKLNVFQPQSGKSQASAGESGVLEEAAKAS